MIRQFTQEEKEALIREAQKETAIAIEEGNGPFAALLVDKQGNIIYKTHNTSYTTCDTTAHAEINIIRMACQGLNKRDLSEYVLVSNAECCSMCFSAAIKAKITQFLFGAPTEEHANPHLTVDIIKEHCLNKDDIHIQRALSEQCTEQIASARKSM